MTREGDLQRYYDREAAAGARAAMGSRGRRDELRAAFIEQLGREGRRSVVEIGAGPGTDAPAFIAADLRYVGFDLSFGNARLARGAGVPIVPGSLYAPPLRPGAFESGWTMSTLLHVPDDRFDEAMEATTALLRPGSPLAIGLWGGVDREAVREDDLFEPPRFFSRRSHDRAEAMLARHGDVETFETWENDRGKGCYQFAILRVG